MHKESHQHLDLVKLFEPITKYSGADSRARVIIPEIVRKAFKTAETEKPGVSASSSFPENIAAMEVEGHPPLNRSSRS